MEKETKQDTLQQIVDELASVGAKGGQDVTKDKVADLMAKALKVMDCGFFRTVAQTLLRFVHRLSSVM